MVSSLRRPLAVTFVAMMLPLLAACPKKENPTPVSFDAGPPAAPVASDTDLQPLTVEDAGADSGVDAGTKKATWTGPSTSGNVGRLKQCCAALGKQAAQLGASPEAGMVVQAAAQCNIVAAQAGPTGSAPELGVIRTALQGKNVPPVCAGF